MIARIGATNTSLVPKTILEVSGIMLECIDLRLSLDLGLEF